MPRRVRLLDGDTTWTSEVDGSAVRFAGDDAPAEVHVEAAGAASTGAATGAARVLVATSGDVAVTGDVAEGADATWVQIGATVFEFRRWRGASAHSADALTPPMSATVVRVAVKVGDAVKQGDLLVALEAMKMELPIRAPHDGVVRAVHCREGDLVQPGTVLISV